MFYNLNWSILVCNFIEFLFPVRSFLFTYQRSLLSYSLISNLFLSYHCQEKSLPYNLLHWLYVKVEIQKYIYTKYHGTDLHRLILLWYFICFWYKYSQVWSLQSWILVILMNRIWHLRICLVNYVDLRHTSSWNGSFLFRFKVTHQSIRHLCYHLLFTLVHPLLKI